MLELQPLFCDGADTDALHDAVEELIWELEAMGLVRVERLGGAGEPFFFPEHPALLAEI
jgi:hypothetical protein